MSVAIAESLRGAVDAVEGAPCEPSTSSGATASVEACVAEWAEGALSSVAVLIDRAVAMADLSPNSFGADRRSSPNMSLMMHRRPEAQHERTVSLVHWRDPCALVGQRVALDADRGVIWSIPVKMPFFTLVDPIIILPDVGVAMRHRSKTMGRPTMPSQVLRLKQMWEVALVNQTELDRYGTWFDPCIVCRASSATELSRCPLCLQVFHLSCWARVFEASARMPCPECPPHFEVPGIFCREYFSDQSAPCAEAQANWIVCCMCDRFLRQRSRRSD